MKCICCGAVLKPLDTETPEVEQVFDVVHRTEGRTCRTIDMNNRSWNDGATGIISAGYGSKHDGDVLGIAICDKCIDEKLNNGTIAYIDNNIFRSKEVKQNLENHKQIWINNNL